MRSRRISAFWLPLFLLFLLPTRARFLRKLDSDDLLFPGDDDGSIFGGGDWSCFPGDVTVSVLGRGDVRMKDLQVRDEIEVWSSNGKRRNSQVYSFAHRDEEKEAAFIQIFTSDDDKIEPLEMTPDHLIFVLGGDGGATSIPAGAVQVGDLVLTQQGESSKSKKVVKTETMHRRGIYAPLTQEGHFLANGIAVSSYISLQPSSASPYLQLRNQWAPSFITHHFFAHLALTPYRIACLSFGSSMCYTTTTTMPSYVEYAIQTAELFHSFPPLLQWIILLAMLFGAGLLWAMELLFGPTLACILGISFWIAAAAAWVRRSYRAKGS